MTDNPFAWRTPKIYVPQPGREPIMGFWTIIGASLALVSFGSWAMLSVLLFG